jgi:hypothetical protein
MIVHGAIDLLCTLVRDRSGVEIHNEPPLTDMTADGQKLREVV